MIGPNKELFEFDSFRLDPAERLLLRGGELVPLEPKVFETLLVLIRNDGRLVAKEELMQAVWPDSFVEESNLTRNISVLRKALNRTDGGPQYIETVSKRGYRFVGEVRRPAAERADLILQSAKVSVLVEEQESEGETDEWVDGRGRISESRRIKVKRKLVTVLLAATALIAISAVGIIIRPFGSSEQTIDSLAVLPFVNTGNDPETEFLSDGITDGLINGLSQLPRLKVMSRNSVFRYKGSETDAQQAGRSLGVRAVLTGRVMQRGNDLLISAELVNVGDNSHLWGEQYNRKLEDLQAVQAEISRDISEKLRLKLSSRDRQRLTKRGTENAEAYELYLKGRYHLNSLSNEADKSLGYFKRAAEKDPNYALPYAGLAEAYVLMADVGTTFTIPPNEAFAKAKEAASKAIELDDKLAEAHTSLGQIARIFEWDWDAAEREYKRAIELNPNYVNAHHWYSHYLINMGRFDESLTESQLALALDPLDVGMTFHLGYHYYNARQYDRAIPQLQKVFELNPNHSEAHNILGLVYEQQGRYPEAIAELKRGSELRGIDNRGNLGHVYAVSGRGEAKELLNQLQEEAKRQYVSPYQIALIYEGQGNKDQAFAWLEKAVSEHDTNLTDPGLKVDATLDYLRSDPRFAELLRRIGLAQ